MSQTEIWTDRLFLREAHESDLQAFNKWFRDPDTMKYWSTPPHVTIERTKKYLDSMIESAYNGVLDFVICLPHPPSSPAHSDSEDIPETVIGKAGLYDGKEIGIILHKEYWGKGYAFEALDAIVKHFWAITDDPAATMKADVDPRNKASLRLLLKLGFVVVGSAEKTYETHIGWCDSVYLEARRP